MADDAHAPHGAGQAVGGVRRPHAAARRDDAPVRSLPAGAGLAGGAGRRDPRRPRRLCPRRQRLDHPGQLRCPRPRRAGILPLSAADRALDGGGFDRDGQAAGAAADRPARAGGAPRPGLAAGPRGAAARHPARGARPRHHGAARIFGAVPRPCDAGADRRRRPGRMAVPRGRAPRTPGRRGRRAGPRGRRCWPTIRTWVSRRPRSGISPGWS